MRLVKHAPETPTMTRAALNARTWSFTGYLGYEGGVGGPGEGLGREREREREREKERDQITETVEEHVCQHVCQYRSRKPPLQTSHTVKPRRR